MIKLTKIIGLIAILAIIGLNLKVLTNNDKSSEMTLNNIVNKVWADSEIGDECTGEDDCPDGTICDNGTCKLLEDIYNETCTVEVFCSEVICGLGDFCGPCYVNVTGTQTTCKPDPAGEVDCSAVVGCFTNDPTPCCPCPCF